MRKVGEKDDNSHKMRLVAAHIKDILDSIDFIKCKKHQSWRSVGGDLFYKLLLLNVKWNVGLGLGIFIGVCGCEKEMLSG